VARDSAFCFYYPENIELLELAGARIVYFSPMDDESLPPHTDGIYLGGGYPELHAERLAGNARLRGQIADASAAGMPIYGECGGFMYLCDHLEDMNGRRFPMTGCFPWGARMLDRRSALGYREVNCTADTVVGPAGTVIRGHEFHYSILDPRPEDAETVYRITGRMGGDAALEGYRRRQTLGSYVHLHFGSAPAAAPSFVERCGAYRADTENRE
jgi:cobyrinic acid a,c-diamide synthase